MAALNEKVKVLDILPSGATNDWVAERRLNDAFARVFRGPAGAVVLAELERLTRNRVTTPPYAEGVLQFLEGARALYGLIVARIDFGKEGKPDAPKVV